MTAFFVTGSGTDIGKTLVTAALLRHLNTTGKKARAVKPVLSGFEAGNIGESDSALLLAARGQDPSLQNIEAISPWKYKAALAPNMAAQREGAEVDIEAVVKFCSDEIEKEDGILFIEGVGGVMAPLTDTFTVLDWIEALMIPPILVTGSYLGAISHALTSLRTIQARGMEVPVVVISESEGSEVPLGETLESVAHLAGNVRCIALPRAADAQAAAITELSNFLLEMYRA